MHIRIPARVAQLGSLIFTAAGGADIVLGMWAMLNGDGALAMTLLGFGGTALGILTWGVGK